MTGVQGNMQYRLNHLSLNEGGHIIPSLISEDSRYGLNHLSLNEGGHTSPNSFNATEKTCLNHLSLNEGGHPFMIIEPKIGDKVSITFH